MKLKKFIKNLQELQKQYGENVEVVSSHGQYYAHPSGAGIEMLESYESRKKRRLVLYFSVDPDMVEVE